MILTGTINKAREKMWFFGLNNTPAEAIFDSVKILEIYIESIDKIRDVFLSKKLGRAQLMMMAGMFVTAEHFESSVSPGIYTHFKVEEKANLGRGRLEEELARMSGIVDHLKSGSLLLMNESFSSTNEREGSEIAREILRALIEKGVRIIYVTHFYELQRWFSEHRRSDTLFLKAERRSDGTRTYRIIPGEPEKTSYAEEVYLKVFKQRP